MKRIVTYILLFSFLFTGCSVAGERIKEPVTFYYVHHNYQVAMEEVIAKEIREAAGHRNDLPYLLALYSMGPSDKNLSSPFPENTTILPIEHSDEGLVLSLLDNDPIISDAEYTLASACLAMTCMELIDTDQVTVICGDRSITINKDNLLTDSNSKPNTPEESK